jgi:hypothetical protein
MQNYLVKEPKERIPILNLSSAVLTEGGSPFYILYALWNFCFSHKIELSFFVHRLSCYRMLYLTPYESTDRIVRAEDR